MAVEKSRKRPSLEILRNEAAAKITVQLKKGRELLLRSIGWETELDLAKKDLGKWEKYTYEILIRMFDTDDIAEEFSQAGYTPIAYFGGYSIQEEIRDYRRDVSGYVHYLEGLYERLELYPELLSDSQQLASVSDDLDTNLSSKKVFIVHGHDNEAKETVARFTEKLGLEAVILHEKASGGRTIIEKIEAHSEVGFAVVLFTPDDVGYPKDQPEKAQQRTRQNVVLELGYFMAKLGRDKVAVLYKDGVEMPSDYQGVLYTSLDAAGAWKFLLAKEMKATGIEVDMNKI